MSEISRRLLLAGAGAPLLAQQAATTAIAPAPARDTVLKRHLLSGRCTAESLQKALVDRAAWKPFPVAADRGAWTALQAESKDTVIKQGESFLGKAYEPLPATLFLEYARTGNRSHWEGIQFGRRAHLRAAVLAECVEGKGRFLDDIADGVWAICEETFWGVPAHMGAQKRGVGLPDVREPIIELFSAETGALLAWTSLSTGQADRPGTSADPRAPGNGNRAPPAQRLPQPAGLRLDGADQRPSREQLESLDPFQPAHLRIAARRRSGAARPTVYKILTSLDRFLDSYHDDGGCDEGPGYWNRAGASLFECLELLHSASNGSVNYFDLPLVRQIGAYIYKVHIADDWYVNFADAPAKVKPDGSLVYRYGKATRRSRSAGLRRLPVSALRLRPGKPWAGASGAFPGHRDPRGAGARSPGTRGLARRHTGGGGAPRAQVPRMASTLPRWADTTRRATITTTWATSWCTSTAIPC